MIQPLRLFRQTFIAACAYIEVALAVLVAMLFEQQNRSPTEVTQSLEIIDLVINFQLMSKATSHFPARQRPTFKTVKLILLLRLTHSTNRVCYPLLMANHAVLFLREFVVVLVFEQIFEAIFVEVGQLMPFDAFILLLIFDLLEILGFHMFAFKDMGFKLLHILQRLANLWAVGALKSNFMLSDRHSFKSFGASARTNIFSALDVGETDQAEGLTAWSRALHKLDCLIIAD